MFERGSCYLTGGNGNYRSDSGGPLCTAAAAAAATVRSVQFSILFPSSSVYQRQCISALIIVSLCVCVSVFRGNLALGSIDRVGFLFHHMPSPLPPFSFAAVVMVAAVEFVPSSFLAVYHLWMPPLSLPHASLYSRPGQKCPFQLDFGGPHHCCRRRRVSKCVCVCVFVAGQLVNGTFELLHNR